MTVIYVICMLALIAAALLVLVRVERGPSMLDRGISVDVITAAIIGFIAVFSVAQKRSDLTHIMAALALVGFLSTVTLARFAAHESDADRHILTREEFEELHVEDERLPDDAAPVHDVDALAEAEEERLAAAVEKAEREDGEGGLR
ncbi:MAG TPA: monovalent cation/H+ antiporter complex subunit F [Actinomycetaceae bacterium]|nr:monovalent cation/H+ antiporter complex subunit F [Actinomycetaceae bacterium]